MDFALSKRQEKIRASVREFLAEELTDEVKSEVAASELGPATRAFYRKLGARGWLAPMLPMEYGGLAYPAVEALLVANEIGCAGGPGTGAPLFPEAPYMVGPVLMRFGNEKQRGRFLPKIASGEIEFALGYSEPEAGSDLAALSISAENRGNYYVINGQKIWSSNVHNADYHWLAARTDPKVPKHKGISLFIVDLTSPGITISPLWLLKDLRASIVYYDNVRVPQENLVGEENKGWRILTTALGAERVMGSSGIGYLWYHYKLLVEYIRDNKALAEDILVQQRLGEVIIRLQLAELLIYRVAWMADRGIIIIPTYEASAAKLFVSEANQYFYNVAMKILGLYGQLQRGSQHAPLRGGIERGYRLSPLMTILAGTSEIQKYIIAVRGLALPGRI